MWQALGQLLPIAIAAALSSVPIMATILILLSDHRDQAALPFLAGSVVGAAAILTLATVLAQSTAGGGPRAHETWVGVLEVLIGASLILLGLVAVRRRRTAEPSGRMPGWMGRVGSLRPAPAFGLGLALNIRPKALLLIAAAGLLLRTASLSVEGTALVMALFIVAATSTVAVPVVVTLMSPDWMGPRLIAARDWIAVNGPVVTGAVVLLVGVFLVVAGLAQV